MRGQPRHQQKSDEVETVDLLCKQIQSGDREALDALASLACRRLRSIAARILGHPTGNPSMGPTALVNEGFARLLTGDALTSVIDANHFYSLFSLVMRQTLVDYSRTKKSLKYGGHLKRLDFDVILSQYSKKRTDIEDVSEAIEGLGKKSSRAATILEMQCFGQMKVREIVQATGFSVSTVEGDLRIAKAFVRDWMSRDD